MKGCVIAAGIIGLIGAAVITCVVVLFVIGAGVHASSSSHTYRVQYRVTGSAESVGITMKIPGGGTEQHTYDVPFVSAPYEFKRFDVAYISAQNKDDSGSVKAEIVSEGQPIRSATSNGGYSIASVSWSAGSDR